MPITLRKINAQVKDPNTGEMIPAGILSSDSITQIAAAENAAITRINSKKTEAINQITQMEETIPSDYADFSAEAAYKDMIAQTQAAMTATKSYTVGEYICVNKKLYKTTTAITSGLALVVGTNVEEIKLAESVSASAAQIATNTNDISDLKTQLNLNRINIDNANHLYNIRVATLIAPSASANANFDCTEIDCSAGDVFTIHANGGTNCYAYAFIDADRNIIIRPAKLGEFYGLVKAPENAAKLIINRHKKNADYNSYYGYAINKNVSDSDNIINTILNFTGINILDLDFIWGSRINQNGNIITGENSYCASKAIALNKGERVIAECRGYTNTVAIISTCDIDGNNITPIIISPDNEIREYIFTAENNCYIRISWYYPGLINVYKLNVYRNEILNEKINDIDIDTLENSVNSLLYNTNTDIVTLNNKFSEYANQALMKKRVTSGPNISTLPKILSIAHFSDLHASQIELERIIKFKNHYAQYFDDAICSGDMVRNTYANGMDFWYNTEGNEDILMCIGNHDVAVTGNYSQYGITVQEAYDRYFAPNIAQWNVVHSGNNTYYYKDYVDSKTRMIVLDYLLTGTDADNQNTWFANVLNDAITNDLAVICVEHVLPNDFVHIDCSFTSYYNNQVGTCPDSWMTLIDNFINNGGTFLAWLCGHAHNDYVGYSSSHPKQLFIAVCTANGQTGYEDVARVIGEKSQDGFNVVFTDRYAKLVKVVRVGVSVDSVLRPMNTLCINIDPSNALAVVSNN